MLNTIVIWKPGRARQQAIHPHHFVLACNAALTTLRQLELEQELYLYQGALAPLTRLIHLTKLCVDSVDVDEMALQNIGSLAGLRELNINDAEDFYA